MSAIQSANIATGPRQAWHRLGRIASWVLLTVLFAVMAIRQHRLVDRYSVNMMFGDQWDFCQPFQGDTLWGSFDHQHGPHRQGVGLLLTRVIAYYSRLNSRWDSFGLSFVLIAAAAFGLLLAYLCGLRNPLAFLPIPMLYLTGRQWEHFVCASNISHGAMPILLFTLYGIAWFIRPHFLRLLLISLLTFCLIFTGFGIFVGLVTPMILLVEAVQAARAREFPRAAFVIAALIANAISWWMFSWNYVFQPAAAGFRFPYEKPLEYLYFIGMMFANYFGLSTPGRPAVLLGLFIAGCLGFLCLFHGWRFLRNGVIHQPTSVVIFALAAYSLIYCVNTAIGHVFLNWTVQATASRYVTLMIPAGLAIFLHLATRKPPRLGTTLALLYAFALIPCAFYIDPSATAFMESFRDRRVIWRRTYLATQDVHQADAASGFQVYPASNDIIDRLNYLRLHQLNLFTPRP